MDDQEAARIMDEGVRVMRRTMSRIGADLFLVWGAVYVLAPLSALLWPKANFGPGLVLIGIGVVATILLGARSPIQSESGWKVGVLWGTLFAFSAVWIFILTPQSDRIPSENLWAFFVSVAMLAYVVMGLWSYLPLLFIGIAVTACQVVGLLWFSEWFWIWTAVTGGGTMLTAGFVLRRNSSGR